MNASPRCSSPAIPKHPRANGFHIARVSQGQATNTDVNADLRCFVAKFAKPGWVLGGLANFEYQ